MANPYNPSQPADPVRAFAGREEELRRIRSCVEATREGTVRNAFIGGEWGIGKTSLLAKLRPEIQEHGPVVTEILSESRDHQDQAAWFYNAVFSELIDDSGVSDSVIDEDAFRDPRKVRKLLMRLWEGLGERFRESREGFVVVIMLDEVERARPEFLAGVRDVFQRLAQDGARYMLVFAGRRLPASSDAADPVGRFFQPRIELRPFDETSSIEAIRKPVQFAPLKFSDEAGSLIHQRAAGHPFFLKSICSEIYERVGGKGEIDRERLEELWPEIEERLASDKFHGSFAECPEGEQLTLLRASMLGPTFEVKELRAQAPRSLDTFIKRLLERELIRSVSRGVYEVYHPLFRTYLQSVARRRGLKPNRVALPDRRPALARDEIEEILAKSKRNVDLIDQHFRGRAVSMLEAVPPGARIRVLMGEDPAWPRTCARLEELDVGLRKRVLVRAWPDKSRDLPVPWHYRALLGDVEVWTFDHSLDGAGKKKAYLQRITDPAQIRDLRDDFERFWESSTQVFPSPAK